MSAAHPTQSRPTCPESEDTVEPAPSIRLIVQADDFGMCHAVNEGVVEAFENGILTQASVMAPCPWFGEAVVLAKRHTIPVGLHGTLTCEWDAMRWRPLTAGSSLVRHDGTFHESVLAARTTVRPDEAATELRAQARAMATAGLAPTYVDAHMGMVSPTAYENVCELYRRPFILPVVPRFLWLNSFLVLSPRTADEKRRTLLDYLEQLPPGHHLIQSHPAVASRELRALATPGSDAEPWAEAYRVSDLALLTDPAVVALVERRGIELVAVADLDASVIATGWTGSVCARRRGGVVAH